MASKSLTNVPEQNHEAMRAAAMRPVEGPAVTDRLAAGGGLELPGGEQPNGAMPIVGIDSATPHEPIPGEHDGTTLTHRQAGAMGGAFNGADNAPGDDALTEEARRELYREGGGGDAERLFEKKGGR